MSDVLSEKMLITGASGGVGEALARILATQNRYELILVARSHDKLQRLRDILIRTNTRGVRVHSLDLSQLESLEKLIELEPSVDILINNAGRADFGKFEKINLESHQFTLDLNVRALSYLTHRYGLKMLEHRKGVVLNVSSIAAIIPTPYMSLYAGTKAFVTSFSQALDEEWKVKGVRVLYVSPGGIKSQFHIEANLSDDIVKKFDRVLSTPEEVARDIIIALKSYKTGTITGAANRLIYFLNLILPTRLMVRSNGKIYREFVD